MVGVKGRSGKSAGSRGHHKQPHSQKTKETIRKKCREAIVTHHIDGNHYNNDPNNLMQVTPKEHAIIHNLMKRGYTIKRMWDLK
jgi:hypothetical protein